MRLFLPMLVTAALAGSAAAVKINIYPNSESCDDNSGWLQCDNVAERACCQSKGRDIFSAKFIAMDSSGVPDQVSCIGIDTHPSHPSYLLQTPTQPHRERPTDFQD